MLAYFKTGGVLHYKYAHQIITEATQALQELSTVVNISIPETGRMTVCGDIHGQLSDLLTIFTQNGI
jgi:serine/threonine-protein phosphatase 5